MSPEDQQVTKTIAILGTAGLIAGLGTLLASKERLTARIVVGRAISSFALGVTASVALLWFPDMMYETKVGISCLVASLGTSGLERLFQKFYGNDK